MSEITKRISEIPPEERRTMLARLLRERAQQKPKTAPLSFAQERLYFLERLHPGSNVYNIPMPVGLPGAVDVEVLRRSLTEMVRRHEVLRTTFTAVDGKPVQVISPSATVEMPLFDLSSLPAEARAAEAGRLTEADARRPFDLAQGPLFRAALIRLAPHEHLLLLAMHHIVSDGWSMAVFFRELWSVYQAFMNGQPSPLAPLPMQYADFAAAQRRELSGEAYAALCRYWKGQLAGAPPLLSLFCARPRPPVQSFRGANLAFAVPPATAEALHAISKRENATLFMTLLAAYCVLLHRQSAHGEIVVGTPIAGRNRADIEGLIGFFVNTLVLRVDLAGDPTFRALIGRVRAVTLAAYEHQDLPFEKLVEEMQPERNPSHAPLCQVVFAWQNVPTAGAFAGPPPLPPEADLEDGRDPPEGTAKFDLQLTMGEVGPAISGSLEYNLDLFAHEDMRELLRRFRTLLGDIVADPERPISALRLLSKEQVGGLSPRDFPDGDLTQRELEELVTALRPVR